MPRHCSTPARHTHAVLALAGLLLAAGLSPLAPAAERTVLVEHFATLG